MNHSQHRIYIIKQYYCNETQSQQSAYYTRQIQTNIFIILNSETQKGNNNKMSKTSKTYCIILPIPSKKKRLCLTDITKKLTYCGGPKTAAKSQKTTAKGIFDLQCRVLLQRVILPPLQCHYRSIAAVKKLRRYR